MAEKAYLRRVRGQVVRHGLGFEVGASDLIVPALSAALTLVEIFFGYMPSLSY